MAKAMPMTVRAATPDDPADGLLYESAKPYYDADFARQLTRSKLAGGASKRRVHQELFKGGVARDVASSYL